MENLKVIPQVFFDLIGRVVPGAFGIVASLLISGTSWEDWLSVTLGKSLAPDSSVVAVLLFVAAAYVLGQLLSPVAKLIQRFSEMIHPGPRAKDYDLLRLKYPEAGGFCAKIRAEFTMHNGLAAVFLLSAIAYPFRDDVWRWSVLVGLALLGLLEAIRGSTTRDTFNKTVNNFAKAVGHADPDM